MKNRQDEIRTLLDLYYKGESTPEQEQILSELLESASGLSPDLEPDRHLFAALRKQAEGITAPDSIERNVMAAIGVERKSPFRFARRLYIIAGAAASIALLVFMATGLLTGRTEKSDSSGETRIACVITPPAQTHSETQAPLSPRNDNTASAEESARPIPRKAGTHRSYKTDPYAPAADESKESSSLTPEEEETILKGLRMLDKAGEELAQARATTISGLETAEAAFQKFD